MDMPKVALGSVVGTTFMKTCSGFMPKAYTPMSCVTRGIQSTGTRSMVFSSRIHTNRVSASGAMSSLRAENAPRTWLSMNSTVHSTKFRKFEGVPVLTFFAALPNTHKNSTPRMTDHSMVST
jgi:hypothetical protein